MLDLAVFLNRLVSASPMLLVSVEQFAHKGQNVKSPENHYLSWRVESVSG